jgi:hypothetical protein
LWRRLILDSQGSLSFPIVFNISFFIFPHISSQTHSPCADMLPFSQGYW